MTILILILILPVIFRIIVLGIKVLFIKSLISVTGVNEFPRDKVPD